MEITNEQRNRIISAISEGSLIVFVGAGFSRLCGIAGWDDFANSLLNKCVEKKHIDFSLLQRITDSVGEPKKKITIAKQIFTENGDTDTFYNIFKNYLEQKPVGKQKTIKKILISFIKQMKAFTVTTNADEVLDECFEKQCIYYDERQIEKWELPEKRKQRLVHIHGSMKRNESLVFTLPEYLSRYKNLDFKNYLTSVFQSDEFTILFIGYGMNEFELLEYFFDDQQRKKSLLKGRYIYNGFFKYEKALAQTFDTFYLSLGIEQIVFYKDKNGFNELAFELKKLMNEVNSQSTHRSQSIRQAIELLKETPNEQTAPELIQLSNGFSENETNLLFANIENSPYSNDWIKQLYKSSFDNTYKWRFGFEYFKEAKKTKNGYQGIRWNGFESINNISCVKTEDEELKKIAQKYILDTLDHLYSNPKLVSNFYLMYRILEFIFNSVDLLKNTDLNKLLRLLLSSNYIDLHQVIHVICDEKSKIKSVGQETRKVLFQLLFAKFSTREDRNDGYYLDMISESLVLFLMEQDPLYIYHACTDYILKKEKESPFSFGEIGSIRMFPEDQTGLYEFKNYIFKWLKGAIKRLNKEQIQDLYAGTSESQSRILSKISAYLVAEFFETLKNEFFNSSSNPFENIEKIPDLFFLIQNNLNEFSREQAFKIYTWIKELPIKNENMQIINFCQASFIIALLKGPYNDFIKEKKNIGNLISGLSLHEVNIEDVSKQFYFSRAEWKDEVMGQFEIFHGKTINEIKAIIVSKPQRLMFEKETNARALTKLFLEDMNFLFSNKDYIVDNMIDYFSSVTKAIRDNSISKYDAQGVDLLQQVISLKYEQIESNELRTILWILESKNFIEKFPRQSYDISKTILIRSLKDKNDYIVESGIYQYLVNNTLFVAIRIFNYTVQHFNEKFKEATNLLYDLLNGVENKEIIKSAIVESANAIDFYSPNFLKERLEVIFNNEYLGVNWSVIVLSWVFDGQDKFNFVYQHILDSGLAASFLGSKLSEGDEEIKHRFFEILSVFEISKKALVDQSFFDLFGSLFEDEHFWRLFRKINQFSSKGVLSNNSKIILDFASKMIVNSENLDAFEQTLNELFEVVANVKCDEKKEFWDALIKLSNRNAFRIREETIQSIKKIENKDICSFGIFFLKAIRNLEDWELEYEYNSICEVFDFLREKGYNEIELIKKLNDFSKIVPRYHEYLGKMDPIQTIKEENVLEKI